MQHLLPEISSAFKSALEIASGAIAERSALEETERVAKQAKLSAESARDELYMAVADYEIELAIDPESAAIQKKAEAARKALAKNVLEIERWEGVLAGVERRYTMSDAAIKAAFKPLDQARGAYLGIIAAHIDNRIESAAAEIATALALGSRLYSVAGVTSPIFRTLDDCNIPSFGGTPLIAHRCFRPRNGDGLRIEEMSPSLENDRVYQVLSEAARVSRIFEPRLRLLENESKRQRSIEQEKRRDAMPDVVYRVTPSETPPSPFGPKSAFRAVDDDENKVLMEKDELGRFRSYKMVKRVGSDELEKQYGFERDGQWYPDAASSPLSNSEENGLLSAGSVG